MYAFLSMLRIHPWNPDIFSTIEVTGILLSLTTVSMGEMLDSCVLKHASFEYCAVSYSVLQGHKAHTTINHHCNIITV